MTRPTAMTAAADWLRQYLAEQAQPVQASVVLAAARQAGFAERTLRRASTVVGVRITPHGFGGGTLWSLPEPPAEPSTPPQPAPADEPAPVGVDVPTGKADPFGRYREHVRANSIVAAQHWDERLWHRQG
ncbi:hypothetical protein AB0M46_45620 [Dactylosporangium sp. NPDC051485]|uniref:hypothetical protein n=1 Tax=Dactylosporangium sp. NPDC051485 TaxID=3154846 RepID=UPI00342B42DA